MKFTTVAIGGFTSNSGKTELVCELLRAFSGWEAIKISRGHYRSCGRDPEACCVSPLLGQEPTVRTGRRETYAPGKDTGRYWEAGATNVHWLIATNSQIERGIGEALARVRAPGVFIEGNSFLRYVGADFVLMAARADGEIKPTARRALPQVSAFYLSDAGGGAAARAELAAQRRSLAGGDELGRVPIYTREDLPKLIERLRTVHGSATA